MQRAYYDNPRLLILTVALVLVAGLSALQVLPRLEDPELISRNAVVQTPFPGATAERVEALVTRKIEDELRELEEIRKVESTSRAGFSTVSIELDDSIDAVDEVWSRVRDALDDVAPELPEGAAQPDFEEAEISAFTYVAGLVWDSPGEPNAALLGRLSEDLEQRLLGVPGTRDVERFGEPVEEILVEVDPAELAALGLSIADLSRVIQRSDAKVAAGSLRGRKSNHPVEVLGELDSVDRLERLPVDSGADGRFVRLGDVARIEKTVDDPPAEIAILDGRRGVAVAARMESGTRVDLWRGDLDRELAGYRAELPRGIALETIYDQSGYTQRRLAGLFKNLLLGAAAVLVVVLATMGWRSVVLVGTALPLSMLMVLAGMRMLGIPMHQMSVTGLIIALGLLIDNAIVVVDEVRHRLDAGATAGEAVAGTVRGLFVPLFGSTLTTVLAFMPIVLMPGGPGEFVGTMAVSVILALCSSFFLAMTVIPALAGRLLPAGRHAERSGFLERGWGSERLSRATGRFLERMLARPVLAMAGAALLPLIGFGLAGGLEEQFFPSADRDQLQVEIEFAQSTSLDETLQAVERARALLEDEPAVAASHWFVGTSAPKFYYNLIDDKEQARYYAQALVQLADDEGVVETARRLQERLDRALPAAQVLARQLEQGPPYGAPVEVHLYGPDLDELDRLGAELRVALAESEGVIHTRATLESGRPKLWVRLDEEEARLAGLDNVGVAERLRGSLDGTLGGSILESTEELPVRVRLARDDRGDLDRLAALDLIPEAGAGSATTLAALGEVELRPEFASIPHRHGKRVNSVRAWVEAGTLADRSLQSFLARPEVAALELPPGYRMEIGGESAERDRAVGNLAASVGVLLVLMAAALVLSFNSFRVAGIVFAVAGLSVGLSLLALVVFGHPFGFMAIVGTMGLIGVAINDAIVVLAALRRDADARRGDLRAAARVTLANTRHVLATSLTTMAGFAPLILAGGSFWPPVAVSIGGGVAGATILALTFVPAAYLLVSRQRASAPATRPEPVAFEVAV